MAVVLMVYLLATVVVTWPLITELDTVLPGSSTDILVHFWNGWWVGEALAAHDSPFYTNYIFYPHGVSLVYHNIAWLTVVPWLLLRVLFDGIVAFNLVLMANLFLCGIGAFLLVIVLTGQKLPALLAGIVYLAWPFRLSQLDHPNLVSTYWIPISLLFLILTLRKRRTGYAVLTGVSLALVGYTRWQLLIPAGFVFLTYLLGTAPGWFSSRRHWLNLFLAAGVAAALLAPPAFLLARELGSTQATSEDLLREGEESVMQTDLLAYVTPPETHPWWGEQFGPVYERYYFDRSEGRRYPAFIGLTVLLLAAIGVWRQRRESIPWLLMAGTLVMLALGLVLRIGGQLFPQVPTLYSLLEPLYFVRLIRVPDRFNVILALPFAVLAAYGLAFLLARIRDRRLRLSFTALTVILVLFEYLAIPIPRQNVKISPFYEQQTRQKTDTAILDLPIDLQKAKRFMFAQTVHERPLVHGKIARIPPDAYAYMDGNPWLSTLRWNREMAPWMTDVGRQLNALAEDGVAEIVLHKREVDAARIARWQRYLSTQPRYEDQEIAVYSTSPRHDVDFVLQEALQPGIGPIDVSLSVNCLNPSDPLEVNVSWGTWQALDAVYQARLALIDGDDNVVHREEVAPMGAWPTDQWPENTIVWSRFVLESLPSLSTGHYDVVLSLVSPDNQPTQPKGQSIQVGEVKVQDDPCRFELPAGLTEAYAAFGDQLRLLGYSVDRRTDNVVISLYWRSTRRMDTDYKIFLHVFEPSTGVPVAQDDSMPDRNTFPTRFWPAGTTLLDRISIPLSGAPSGDYGLAVGVYDPRTMERLPVTDRDGEKQPDGRLVFPGASVRIEDSAEQ